MAKHPGYFLVAATGHRPNKIGGYSLEGALRLRRFATQCLQEIPNTTHVISGMALGWDQAIAGAALDLGLPLIAAVPFKGQESMWPAQSQALYHELLARATKVVYVCEPGYAPWKLQTRNVWMADRCDTMLALWDGTGGGTFNCVRYTERAGKTIVNVWDKYQEFLTEA